MPIGDLIVGIGLSAAAFKALRRFCDGIETDDGDTHLGDSNPAARLGPGRSPMRPEKVEVHSLEDRIERIRKFIREGREDPDVREFVMEVVNRKCGDKWCIEEKDHDAEVIAVFDAVRSQVRYVRDVVSADTYSAAKHTLRLQGGDCDDGAIVLGSTLGAIGYPVKLRVIWSRGSDDWNHIYLLVAIPPEGDSKWVPLDASVNKPAGWEVPASEVVKFKDFEVD